MKTGIFVYSLSGHTLTVAEALKEKWMASGHDVTLERVETASPAKAGREEGELKGQPVTSGYEILVFACPVRGGALPPPMVKFLNAIPTLKDQQVVLVLTHFFPTKWGADQTFAAMKKICASAGADVICEEEVRWLGLNRKREINRIAEDILNEI